MAFPTVQRNIRETPPRAQRKTLADGTVRRRKVPERRQG